MAWNSSGGVSALSVRKRYQLLFAFTFQLKLLLTELVWVSVFLMWRDLPSTNKKVSNSAENVVEGMV